MTTVNKIKEVRKKLGLTQKDFADKCGFSLSVVSQYEIGRRNPSKRALYTICNTFDIQPELLGLSNDSPLLNKKKGGNVDSRVTEQLMDTIDLQKAEIARLNAKVDAYTDNPKRALESIALNMTAKLDFDDVASQIDVVQNNWNTLFYETDQPMSVAKEGRFVNVNTALCNLLGYTEEEMLGKDVFEYIHDDDKERAIGMAEQSMGGGISVGTFKIRKSNGHHCLMELQVREFGSHSSDNAPYTLCMMTCIEEQCEDEECQ